MKSKKDRKNFFELPQKEQKQIIKKAARQANRDQLDLVKRYDMKYGNA